MRDLRPISLCNVIYKIVLKVLANRMKVVLSKCISQEQSASISQRSIVDNAIAGIETIHHMKCKTSRKVGEIALKNYIRKAYDRVNCQYLLEIMRRMGFSENWVAWISLCLH